MYSPVQAPSRPMRKQASLMAKKGIDKRTLAQVMDIEHAISIRNIYIDGDGRISKREGSFLLESIAGTGGGNMLEKFDDDLMMYSYGTSVAVYSKSADASTVIKSNFNTSDPFEGGRYGGYFFVGNGGNKIGRISRTLGYDALGAAFTVGAKLTGGTSGATGTILENSVGAGTDDQTQATQNATIVVGEANATTRKARVAQSFIPAQSSIGSVKLHKIADTGTFTGDVVVKIYSNSSGSPGAVISTGTVLNAAWLALGAGEFTVSVTGIALTPGSTYWISVEPTTNDNANHPNLGTNSAGGYASGSVKSWNVTDGWAAVSTVDLYFKELSSTTVGTLTLGYVSGTFADNETITDSITGTATENGTLTWLFTEITGAPYAKHIKIIASRLYAGNTRTDATELLVSALDTGANPPFTNYTPATAADDPVRVMFRNGGALNSIGSIGSQIVLFYQDGKGAFRIVTLDSGGTLVVDTPIDFQRIDFGGARGAVTTPFGVFYGNSQGVWNIVNTGATNVPYTTQESDISLLLGAEYKAKLDLSNMDLAYFPKKNLILVTCAKESTVNNIVLAFNLEFKAWSEFTNWSFSRFMVDGDNMYAIGANERKIFEIFRGGTDDGDEISVDYLQEIPFDDLFTAKSLENFYAIGKLAPSQTVQICFDIYDTRGVLKKDRLCLSWDLDNTGVSSEGYDKARIGGDLSGAVHTSDALSTGLQDAFGGWRAFIADFMRLRVHITEVSSLPLQLHGFSITTHEKTDIRRRNLSQV